MSWRGVSEGDGRGKNKRGMGSRKEGGEQGEVRVKAREEIRAGMKVEGKRTVGLCTGAVVLIEAGLREILEGNG